MMLNFPYFPLGVKRTIWQKLIVLCLMRSQIYDTTMNSGCLMLVLSKVLFKCKSWEWFDEKWNHFVLMSLQNYENMEGFDEKWNHFVLISLQNYENMEWFDEKWNHFVLISLQNYETMPSAASWSTLLRVRLHTIIVNPTCSDHIWNTPISDR